MIPKSTKVNRLNNFEYNLPAMVNSQNEVLIIMGCNWATADLKLLKHEKLQLTASQTISFEHRNSEMIELYLRFQKSLETKRCKQTIRSRMSECSVTLGIALKSTSNIARF